MAKRILLVEDEEHLVDAIKMNLEAEGFYVKTAEDGKKAINIFKEQRFDLIILDIMLPHVDGIKVCEVIRLDNKFVPILILSAKNAPSERVTGLKAGADDYLTKPFDLEEFLLRVQLLIKRSELKKADDLELEEYHFGDNSINFKTYEFENFEGKTGKISARENKLLKLLIERKNQVISRDYILELIWGVDVFPSMRTIDNYLLNFRKNFEKNPKKPQYFHSVRGVGYKFTEED